MWDEVAAAIGAATGLPFAVSDRHSVGGGCINATYRLRGADGRGYFVKTNRPDLVEMFEAEAEGLQAMAASESVKVPVPVAVGVAGGHAYLAMELVELGGHGDLAEFGRQLAALHRTGRARFGWHRDNTIGSTPQPNRESVEWVDFLRQQRLGFQLDLAAHHGHRGALQRKGEQLLGHLDSFFTDYRPAPSLLHGDLWSGNYGFDTAGNAVIFDPAVYFGDREADLAMTELFGGFGSAFYVGYNEAWPLDAGYTVRKTLYNLYHVLNHLNLFGGGYGGQAERMVDRLLSEVR